MLGIKDRDESHIRLYTRNTPEWNLLGWHAQLLYLSLLRHADTDGTIPYRGKTRWEILEFITGIPMKFINVAVRALVSNGWIVRGELAWTVTNYAVTASRAPSKAISGAERARQFRLRRKAERMAMEEVLRRGAQADGSIKIRRFSFQIPPKCESTRVTVRNVTVVRPVESPRPPEEAQKPNGAKMQKCATTKVGQAANATNVNSAEVSSENPETMARAEHIFGPPEGPPVVVSFKKSQPQTVEDPPVVKPPTKRAQAAASVSMKKEEIDEILAEFSLARKTFKPRSKQIQPTPKIVEAIKAIRKNCNATLEDFQDAIWGKFTELEKDEKAWHFFCPESMFKNARNFGMARAFGDGNHAAEYARAWALEKAKPPGEQLVFFGQKKPKDDPEARLARFQMYLKEVYRTEPMPTVVVNLERRYLQTWQEELDRMPREGRTVGEEIRALVALLPPERDLAQYAKAPPEESSKVAEMARGFLDKLNNKQTNE